MPEPRKLALNKPVVTLAVQTLRASKIHPTFAGYLCLKRAERLAGSSKDLRPAFREFFDEYLRPSNGTDGRPYLRPFSSTGDLSSEPWMNQNVAGSYAPSSLRERSPFRRIFSISQGASPNQFSWSFADASAEIAKRELLHNSRIKAWALAVYLYRDFLFESEDGTESLADLIGVFRDEFAFRQAEPGEASQFSMLFDDAVDLGDMQDVFVEMLD